jgi:Fe/S biogenesis protein NfuA
MITITQNAQKHLCQYLDQTGSSAGLRLVISGDIPGAYQPEFILMQAGDAFEEDTLIQYGDLSIYIDPESASKAYDLKIDMLRTVYGPRLKFEFPCPQWDDPVADRLQKLIDGRINPGLISHGGYISLLDVKDGIAEIYMGGGCHGCGLSSQTLTEVIEVLIKQEIPEIHTVIDRTDHATGASPYYPGASGPNSGTKSKPLARPQLPENMSPSARRRARRKKK